MTTSPGNRSMMASPHQTELSSHDSGEHPLVSIIMPAYNAAATIELAIASVLNQTLSNLELLVGDDASTDGTAAIVAAISDPRIRMSRYPVNVGPGAIRDRLIPQARGRWMAFLDADDVILPGRMLRMVDLAMELPDCILFDDIMQCHDTPRGLVPWKRLRGTGAFGTAPPPRRVSFADFVRQDRLLMQPLIPTSAIKDSGIRHPDARFGEDASFVLQLAAFGLPFFYVPEAMYLYRITPGSATANPSRHRLMRECIEGCLQFDGLSNDDRNALRSKIQSISSGELIALLAERLKGGELRKAASMVRVHPQLLLLLPRRLARQAMYQCHRLFHSGRSRYRV